MRPQVELLETGAAADDGLVEELARLINRALGLVSATPEQHGQRRT